MDFEKEVKYRMAKWVFANIYHKNKIDEPTYYRLLNRLQEVCEPPMLCVEERYDENG